MDKIYELVEDTELYSFYRVKLPMLACYAVRPADCQYSFYFPRKSLAIEFMNKYPSSHSDNFWMSRKSMFNSLEYVIQITSSYGFNPIIIES